MRSCSRSLAGVVCTMAAVFGRGVGNGVFAVSSLPMLPQPLRAKPRHDKAAATRRPRITALLRRCKNPFTALLAYLWWLVAAQYFDLGHPDHFDPWSRIRAAARFHPA